MTQSTEADGRCAGSLEDSAAEEVAAVGRIAAVRNILDVVAETTGMGFVAVARVTESRWIACSVRDDIDFGLKPGGELELGTTICDEIRRSGKAVIIDHVAEDPDFRQHATPLKYGFQSYISMPIFRRSGDFFGTLCAIDPRPNSLKQAKTVKMFELFAELISLHLDSSDRLSASEAALHEERRTAKLREQFIAVLGHDLRNPLAAISAGAAAVRRSPPERMPMLVAMMERSIGRMAGLIDNVLDFARGRLGGGLPVTMSADRALEPELMHVVAELRAAWPDRVILSSFQLSGPIVCDPARITQLLSNLLANALDHGDSDYPIRVVASTEGESFELYVSNGGRAIPPEFIGRLFEPYEREIGDASHKGLGLGLYIVSEIARAHGGTIGVVSTEQETRFTFRMPILPR